VEFSDGFVEDFVVGFVSEVCDESALFGAEGVACATDVEVLHGDVEAAAEFGVVFDGL